jgi:hypothetical protein
VSGSIVISTVSGRPDYFHVFFKGRPHDVLPALLIPLLCSGAAADETGKKKKSHPVLTDEQAYHTIFKF